MSIFRRPDYQSDTTQFINQLKAANPQLEQAQRDGRALLWDKKVDRKIWSDYIDGDVPRKSYVYQTDAE
ncbi:MAG: DUF3460 family protein [Burkholderiaceae bacterium]|nr:DUF3460 family protein [Burkholderiaceae bacterium]